MARHFRGTGVVLRFIEFMDVGHTNGWRLDDVVPAAEIVAQIDAELPLEPVEPAYRGEVAARWRYRDGSGEIGVISSVTQPFCGDCTRARLSADGQVYTCLFAVKGHDLRALLRGGASDDELAAATRATSGAPARSLLGAPLRRDPRPPSGRDVVHRRLTALLERRVGQHHRRLDLALRHPPVGLQQRRLQLRRDQLEAVAAGRSGRPSRRRPRSPHPAGGRRSISCRCSSRRACRCRAALPSGQDVRVADQLDVADRLDAHDADELAVDARSPRRPRPRQSRARSSSRFHVRLSPAIALGITPR